MKHDAANRRPFAAVPGVAYPAERGADYLTTAEAADLLGMTESSARLHMRRNRMRAVKRGGRNLWKAARVQELAAKLPPLLKSPLRGFLTRDETLALLGRSLRTLREWESSGKLPFTEVRMGSRRWHIYHEKFVAALAATTQKDNND